MNEESDDDGDEKNSKSKKKRERRSKEEADERNYICGCGKSYLSYAALYTHAKTKHEGIFLEGRHQMDGCTLQADATTRKLYFRQYRRKMS